MQGVKNPLLTPKEQQRIRALAYYRRHRGDILPRRRELYAANREKQLAYHRRWNAVHHQQQVESQRRYRVNHPEKAAAYKAKRRDTILARGREYYRSHLGLYHAINVNRRARIANSDGTYSSAEWEELCIKWENKCLCCGAVKELSVDHVIPLSLGGRNDIGNLQLLCRSCNLRKHTKMTDYRPEVTND
jgi:5-methylcytosine-specific restriction endonuclease McrA